jgi:hypothetical protein
MSIKNHITLLLFMCVTLVQANVENSVDQQVIIDEMKQENLINQRQYKIYKQQIQNKLDKPQYRGPAGTASIAGTVMNQDPIGVINHQLTLYKVEPGFDDWAGSVITDVNGDYLFPDLAAGTYYVLSGSTADDYIDYVWASGANGGPQLCSSCEVPLTSHFEVLDAENVINIDFSIALGGAITGNILDLDSGSGVGSLYPYLINTDENETYNTFANVDTNTGDYSITGIPDGDYRLYLEPNENNLHIPQIFGGPECNSCSRLVYDGTGTVLSIVAANTINNIDFSLNVGASISGFLVDNNTLQPLMEYGLVMVFNELNHNLAYIIVYGTNLDAKATGAYTVGGLLSGSYYVQGGDLGREFYQRELFENRPCYYSGCDRGLGDPVVLSAAENRLGVNFLLNKGGKISGTVLDDEVSPMALPYDGSLFVQFYDASETVVGGADVRPDGTYKARRALAPGSYAVRTGSMFSGAFPDPYLNEKYNDIQCPGVACDLSTADVNVVLETETTGIDFNLGVGHAFSGVITEVGSAVGIPNVNVLVYKDMGVGMEPKFANWATTSDGTSSPVGTFEVFGLSEGTYYARTNNGSNLPFLGVNQLPSDGWIDILYDSILCPGVCDVTAGTPILLGGVFRGGTTINFSLAPGATIAGNVSHFNNGNNLEGIAVNVYDGGGQYMASYNTNSQGEYITSGLPAGTYYLTTTSLNVLVDVKYGNDICIINLCNPTEGVPIVLTEEQAVTGIDMVLKSDYLFGAGFE